MVSPTTCRECGGRGYHTINNPQGYSKALKDIREHAAYLWEHHKAVEADLILEIIDEAFGVKRGPLEKNDG